MWSYIHEATFDLNEMTVVIESKPTELFTLVRGDTYVRHRGDNHHRGDVADCELRIHRRMRIGDEYGNKWG